jgi:hypothetical protein
MSSVQLVFDTTSIVLNAPFASMDGKSAYEVAVANGFVGTVSQWLASFGNTVISVNSKQGQVVLNKSDIGLSNADNTSDVNKPVSTAQSSAIASQALASSPIPVGLYPTADKTKPSYCIRNSVAYAFDVAGNYSAVAANRPVYEYDPITHAYLGLRIAQKTTNLFNYSNDLNSASKQNATITTYGSSHPNAAHNAAVLTSSAAGVSGVSHPTNFSVVSGDVIYVNGVVKAGTANSLGIIFRNIKSVGFISGNFNINTLASGTLGSGFNLTKVASIGGGFVYFEANCVADQTAANASVQLRVINDNADPTASGNTIIIDWGQVTKNTTPSSYVPSGATPATRPADIASYNGIELLQYTDSYTPTPTNIANCTSVTPSLCTYIRQGNNARVTGSFTVTPSAAGLVEFNLSSPITSNFAVTTDAAGSARDTTNGARAATIVADSSADTLRIKYQAPDTMAITMSFSADYKII